MFCKKKLSTIFAKQSILDIWQDSEYTSGLLNLFCCGSKKDTQKRLIYTKLIIVLSPNIEFFPYYKVIYGSATFKLAKG